MVFQLGNTLGFWAFLSLIPLIIFYLIKPKPANLKVPSLMFFFSREKSTTAESILRHFHDDLLFLIQLLVLSLLAFSLVQPALTVKKDAVSSNIVFVLDASASSKVLEGDKTRFEIAKDKIKELVTSRNSLVLIKSRPILVLQGVGRSELVKYLDKLEATDDLSDISSAIILAAELLSNAKGRVVVLSDLISSKGVPVGLGQKILEGKGIPVDFITPAKDNKKNIGIVNMVLTSDTANVYVKNYNDNDENVNLKVGNDLRTFNVKAGSVEPNVFSLTEGDINFEILNKDDFVTDNKIVITKPYGDEIKVMLISSNPSPFLKAALSSITKVKLTTAEPPVIPAGDFDVYIVNKVNKNSLLVGTFKDLSEKIKSGKGNIIVAAWPGMELLDFEGLLPLQILEKEKGSTINVDQVTRFTKDIDFGSVSNYYKVVLKNGLSIASSNGSSLISSFKLDKGELIYYGIMDDESDFKLNPNYPIFWNNLIFYIAGRSDLNDLNLKTGNILEINNNTVTLDKAGVFYLANKKVSVNLLNEKESDINFKDFTNDINLKTVDYKLESVKVYVDYNLGFYLVLIVLFLVIFELGFIKFRGEL